MIRFVEFTHEYFYGDKKLISVTQLMKKHGLSPDYNSVSPEVMNAKAERGTLIHKELEEYIKNHEYGFTDEMHWFAGYCAANNITPNASEFIVHNDVVAGTVDLLYAQDGKTYLADFKTTATLHKDAVSWQLSIYKYLLGKDAVISGLRAFHFTDNELKIVEIPEKPESEVRRLLDCERCGMPFIQSVTVSESDVSELAQIEKIIKGIEAQKKEAEEKADKLRAKIMAAMKENGVNSFEGDGVKITYVAPFTRESVDTAKIKKEYPDVFEQCKKQTQVKESLKISIKEDV